VHQLGTSSSRPRLRGRIHQVAAVASVAGLAWMIVDAHTPTAVLAAVVYGLAAIALYATSSSYHLYARAGRAHTVLRRLDHSMIYVLIAGSYTPVTVLVLNGTWEAVLLSVVWAGAVIGVTLKMARPDGLSVLGAVLYMAMGWLALVALPQLVSGMTPAEVVLMVAGGLFYTVGAIIFASRRPDPRPEVFGYHEIWHSFMVAGAGCHYAMILLVLLAS
jgi:hemolysin III